MAKKSSPNKALSIIIAIVLVVIIGFVMSQSSGGTSTPTTSGATGSNIEIRDGVQYITIDVKGGYKPRTSVAK